MSTRKILNDDAPAPQPPVRPDLDDCCRSGCVPCVFDLYEEELELYRVALKRWQQRQDAMINKQRG
jgi:hypothetical protein